MSSEASPEQGEQERFTIWRCRYCGIVRGHPGPFGSCPKAPGVDLRHQPDPIEVAPASPTPPDEVGRSDESPRPALPNAAVTASQESMSTPPDTEEERS